MKLPLRHPTFRLILRPVGHNHQAHKLRIADGQRGAVVATEEPLARVFVQPDPLFSWIGFWLLYVWAVRVASALRECQQSTQVLEIIHSP